MFTELFSNCALPLGVAVKSAGEQGENRAVKRGSECVCVNVPSLRHLCMVFKATGVEEVKNAPFL